MTSAVIADADGGTGLRGLGRGLSAFVWLLPFHILVMAFLFGALRWPGPVVRIIAAWKEALVAALFAWTLLRLAWRPGPRATVRWLDLAVAGLGIVSFAYLLGAGSWFDAGLPVGAQLYGLRDTAFVTLLYFVGRATPELVEDPRFLRALFVVGVVTGSLAVLERLFVTPGMLVLLGATRYIQDFLGATALTTGNVYGLPDNYWTQIGGHLVRRVGSTYLSAQGFAIPFLIILPAATIYMLSGQTRRRIAWAGYALLWVALLLTITRLTIVACLVQAVVIAAARRRWGFALGVAGAIVGGSLLALVLVPGFATFVGETLTWQTGSSQSHLQDWGEALDNLLRYPLGAGLGSTEQNAVRFGLTPLAADNQYFKFALELGVPGLVLHLLMMGGILATGWRAARNAGGETVRAYGLLVAVAAIGVLINALTAAVLNSMMLAYVFLWLAGAVTSAQDHTATDEVTAR